MRDLGGQVTSHDKAPIVGGFLEQVLGQGEHSMTKMRCLARLSYLPIHE